MKEGSQAALAQVSQEASNVAALAAAAHELKSPLTLINHIVQSLKDPDLNLTEVEQAQYLERLQLTSQRMLRLVQQLTLSYRLGQQRQAAFEFALEPINLSEICQNALHEMSPYAKQLNQELHLIGSNYPRIVLANREILYDILVNLVDNAMRHNQNGQLVEVFSKCRSEQVRLGVRDSGPGVSTAELKRLKQTLGHEPQPLSGRSGTSGLGLYIVGQLVEAMGGSLGMGRAHHNTMFFVDLIRSRQLSLL